MTDKYDMRFQLLTLIDITQTRARKGDDSFLQKQQQNYLTALQTISLRANPEISNAPTMIEKEIDSLGFGKKYTGTHKVWKLNFNFEFSTSHTIETLKEDFNLVPIIKNLNESIELPDSAFITKSVDFANIVFFNTDDFE
jgi:hypothetical protein